MNNLVYFAIGIVFTGFFGTNLAFAETSYNINIPSGASDPSAPYFWQSEKDGSTTGDITIQINDTIVWKNADTAQHTVTSGNPHEGPNNLFDSYLFGPGKSFSYKFTELGSYDYFCLIHPWMSGTVTVVESLQGLKIIHNVGQEVDENGVGVDVEYVLDGNIQNSAVDVEKKMVTFWLVDHEFDEKLIVLLPEKLIKKPLMVLIDEKESEFESRVKLDKTIMTIPIYPDTKEVSIIGVAVIPEFGTIAIAILLIGIVSIIILTTKYPKSSFLRI